MSGVCTAILISGLLLWQTAPGPIGSFQGQSDIGTDLLPGSAVYDRAKDEYEVTGGGENMWANQDAFHFVWRPIQGDVRLEASVHILGTGGNPHRKAGWMIRETLDAGSPYVDVVVHGDGLTSLQYRETKGGETKEVKASVTGPDRLVLERKGDQFTFWVARGAEELKESGSITLKMAAGLYAGLAVCAHDKTRHETAVFSNVKMTAAKE
jgi:TolB protein